MPCASGSDISRCSQGAHRLCLVTPPTWRRGVSTPWCKGGWRRVSIMSVPRQRHVASRQHGVSITSAPRQCRVSVTSAARQHASAPRPHGVGVPPSPRQHGRSTTPASGQLASVSARHRVDQASLEWFSTTPLEPNTQKIKTSISRGCCRRTHLHDDRHVGVAGLPRCVDGLARCDAACMWLVLPAAPPG